MLSRRRVLLQASGLTAWSMMNLSLSGCVSVAQASNADLVWGRRGFSDGRFLKPRAIAIDAQDQLYIVDTTGRIQVFTADGQHLRTWKTPNTENGRPTGLAYDEIRQRLLVADTHYYRMLVFDSNGNPLIEQTIGGTAGHQPGQFAFVTDAVVDHTGCVYIGEYGASDRIQKFSPDGEFLTQWGGTGSEVGKFLRPQSLVVDGETLWVADACNHRIVRFDLTPAVPEMVSIWGGEGNEPGKFYYPYDLAIDRDGTVVVCEYGNQRLQRLTPEGQPLSTWGSPGHAAGQLYQPWGVVLDSQRRVHVLDSNNHRIQRLVTF